MCTYDVNEVLCMCGVNSCSVVIVVIAHSI